jgi:primosomal protein N' (replication factor Y) (superfamily II helicase)
MLEVPVVSKPSESDKLYADVLVPRHLVGPFTYLVPPELKTTVQIGRLVVVPFGRCMVKGAVIALTGTPPSTLDPRTLKEIRTLVTDRHGTEIPPYLLELARMVADSYVAPWGQCLRLVLPFIAPSKSAQSRVILTKQGREALGTKKMDATSLTLLRRVKRRPLGIRTSTLLKDRRQEETVAALLDRGWVQKILIPPTSRRLKTNTLSSEPVRDHFSPLLGLIENGASYPKEWEARIVRAIESGCAARLLVQAALSDRVVLLQQAVRRTLESGRKAVVVVGEMERAQSLATMLAHDHTVETACLHSAVSDDKKAEIWEQIRKDSISVVVGTRSAIFLPLKNIGLIWIDREEDPALKEPQEPRYHAREVAWMRARHEQALLVIASSHLTLEARAIESQENMLRTSVWPSDMPSIEVADLRRDHSTVLSSQLSEAMRDTLTRQAGVLLFLNRKGYAGALICRDCGRVPRCLACAVAFAYSRQKSLLTCHYCGLTSPVPDVCTDCGGSRLQPIGEGTERIEEEVKRRFPTARVLRVDGETMHRPQAALLWQRMQRREWDVLVGTQLILRDDLIPPVGLVGIVQADAGLSLPDFRAAERSFHLIHDAIGLAQPRSLGGRIVLQTYLPSHHTIQAVVQQNETIFEAEEMAQRTVLGFPPAYQLIVLHVSGFEERTVQRAAQKWATRLRRLTEKPVSIQRNNTGCTEGFDQVEQSTVLGPVPPPVPRLQGRYRRQILIKSRCRDAMAQHIRATLTELETTYARRVKFDVDIDPVDMW